MMSDERQALVIIEDDASIRRFLRNALDERYDLYEADEGHQGMQLVSRVKPAVIILDLGLPDMDGLDIIEQLRSWTRTPIVVLSARDQDSDKIRALDAGADDYLIKPFSIGELEARLRVALRHAPSDGLGGEKNLHRFGDVSVDLALRQITKNDEPIRLTPIEYKLLSLLLRYPGRVLTHRQILKTVWGEEFIERNHYLRIYMAQLRQKLEDNPTEPRYLLTELGIGYRLMTE